MLNPAYELLTDPLLEKLVDGSLRVTSWSLQQEQRPLDPWELANDIQGIISDVVEVVQMEGGGVHKKGGSMDGDADSRCETLTIASGNCCIVLLCREICLYTSSFDTDRDTRNHSIPRIAHHVVGTPITAHITMNNHNHLQFPWIVETGFKPLI